MNQQPQNDVMRHAQVLWDYLAFDRAVGQSDFILAMGSHDLRVAEAAAQLTLSGFAPVLVVSGGYGKVTRDAWKMTEAERFAEVAKDLGVPESKIVIESVSANSGENVTLTRDILIKRNLNPRSGILVTKPYMARRAFATASKQWPELRWSVAVPNVSFQHYPTDEVPLDRMIELMVGDVQRMDVYAAKGFQIAQPIPSEIWKSYHYLRTAGYDRFVIPSDS